MKRMVFLINLLLLFILSNIHSEETTLIRDEFYPGYSKLTKRFVNEYLDVDLFSFPYSSAYSFKEKTSDGWWMIGFATDAIWNRIIFADYNDDWIKSFGEYGSGNGQFKSPRGIAADAIGNIFVADYGNDRIVKLRYDFEDEELYFVMNITSDNLSGPIDLDIDYNNTSTDPTDDSIFVINYGNSKVVKFSTDGDFCGSFGERGTGDGQFMHPMGIAKGVKWFPYPSYDDLYVVDTGNRRIVFIQVKWWLGQIDTSYFYYNLPQTSYPRSARTDYFNSLWVTDVNQCQLLKFNWRFDFLTTFGSEGTGWNQFLYPNDFTFAKGYGNSFLTERWTQNSGGQCFIPGTDIIDLSATPNTDYTLVYVDYMLTEHSEVTYYVYDKYEQLVREVEPYNFYPQHLSWIWDCLDDNGVRVPPGKYEIRIVARANYSNGYTKTVSTKVDLRFKIMDFYCDPQAIDVSEEETNITFDLNYDADVTIEIYENNDLLRTVIKDSFFEHGENSVIWDGKDDNGWLTLPGEYQIHIYAEEVMFGHDVEQDIPITIKGTVVDYYSISGVWDKEGSPYIIYGGNKVVYADDTLQILSDTKIMFWPYEDNKYHIGVSGNIKAIANEERRILFSSYRKSWEREKGDWMNLRIMGQKAIFEYCDIEYGGAPFSYRPANLITESCSRDSVIIMHCKISNSAAYGLYSDNDKTIIENNEFAENDSFPLMVRKLNGVGKTCDNLFEDNEYQTIEVGSGVVSDDAVWTDQDVPYFVSGSYFDIRGSSSNPCTLTIEPGVTLQFKKGIRYIGYGSNYKGVLIAEGTEDKKITFCGVSDTSYWDTGINVYNGSLHLSHCLIKNAGRESGQSIYLQGGSKADIDSSEIMGGKGHGIRAYPNADIQIRNCTISECDSFPIVVGASVVDSIRDNTFINNGIQEICVRQGGHLSENAFWQNPGIPYRITTTISVYKTYSETCTLTIDKGTQLKFYKNSGLWIGSNGCGMLNACGTKDEPILFTALDSLERWYGIYFFQYASDFSILRNCEVSFGGYIYENIYCNGSSPRIDSCIIRTPGQIGIYLYGNSSSQITNSNIYENKYGIYCSSSGNPRIHNCNIFGNTDYGINNNTTNIIDADSCWWGSVTGPYDPSPGPPDSNPEGLGDKVSDYVYYRPWLESAPDLLIFSGHISKNTTWSTDILIKGDVWVDAGATLTINAGVDVKFIPNSDDEHAGVDVTRAEFIIQGGLTLLGNESMPITFTSNASQPEIGDWYGIRFIEPESKRIQERNFSRPTDDKRADIDLDPVELTGEASSLITAEVRQDVSPIVDNEVDVDFGFTEDESIKELEKVWHRPVEKKNTRQERNIHYLNVEYAKTGLTICEDEILTMEHCVCRKNETGLKLTGISDVTVKDCDFKDNIISKDSQDYSLDTPRFSVVLKGLLISENNTGILCGGGSKPRMRENKIIDNRDYGVYITDDAEPDFGGMGYNYIYSNGLYDLYNNTDNKIMAKCNCWGTMNIDVVEEHIYDYYDDNSLHIVEVEPLWEGEGERLRGGVMSSGDGTIPLIYSLNNPSPNPFVNSTIIAYSIAKAGGVSVNIYDISGRLVKTLIDEKKDAGIYREKWDGVDNRNRKVAAGVYFTRLTSRNFTSVRKVILVR